MNLYNLIPIVKKGLRSFDDYATNLKKRESAKFLATSEIVNQISKKNYDIVHNHASWRFLLYSPFIKNKIVTTHHGPLSVDYQNLVFQKYKDYPHISISNNQRNDLPTLNFIATIYNGINLSLFPFLDYPKTESKQHMIFLARMSEEKGAIEASQAAKQSGKHLILATKIDKVNEDYFQNFKDLVDDKFVTHVGEVNHDKRTELLQNARCLIAPIKWEEPFGLMFIEAMASGTPVIAFARGAAPEIVVDGVTGFLVNQSNEFIRGNWFVKKTGIDGLEEAVKKIYSMPENEYRQMRKTCRAHVENKFTAQKMVDEYEKIYQQILSK